MASDPAVRFCVAFGHMQTLMKVGSGYGIDRLREKVEGTIKTTPFSRLGTFRSAEVIPYRTAKIRLSENRSL